jgi:hypothetical protein
MTINHRLRSYPKRRISPFDGMSVTSDVWRESHDYHLWHHRLHALSGHGIGIIHGMQVVATEPTSHQVYILPGLAIDPGGNIIVVTEPAIYDLGQLQGGELHLLITYDESPPQSINGRYGDHPAYVHIGFNVETVTDSPDSPQIELARIRRTDRTATIANPRNPEQPGVNEIDMRFRPEIVTLTERTSLLGLATFTPMGDRHHAQGLRNLARHLNRQPQQRIWVEEAISLQGDLSGYDLICLVAKDEFMPEVTELNNLRSYLEQGGTLFLESCRRAGGQNPAADRSFGDLVNSLGGHLTTVTQDADLLTTPHLFPRPAAGYETQGAPQLAGDLDRGILFSTYDYGCLWQGSRRSGPASREEVRAGLEWGENLINFAWKRRSAAP